MRALIKKIIPQSGREAIKLALQTRALRKALQPLRERGQVTTAEMVAIRAAWGNDGFSGDTRYLEETAKLLKTCREPVLECGTGASTLIEGVLAEKYGFDVYCLEQDREWAAVVRRQLIANDLRRVTVIDAPLVRSGDYVWHDVTAGSLPKKFGAIICDGPFVDTTWGEEIHSNWRYGVLPYIRQSGSTFDALLLDDCNDQRAPKVLARWAKEFGAKQDITRTNDGDFGLIRLD
jgi:hypothetical protein